MNTKPQDVCRSIADTLTRKFIEAGVIVHRCDAESGSIYLRLDYGALGTVRIADHASNQANRCRFQIGPYIKQMSTKHTKQGKTRLYGASCRKNLIADALSEREFRIENYGMDTYLATMEGFKTYRKRRLKLVLSPNDTFWNHSTTRRMK